MNESINQERDPLDRALSAIAKDVAPSRDLWLEISAAVAQSSPSAPPAQHMAASRWWMQLAAGVVLVMGSSLITYFVMQRSQQRDALAAQQEVARKLLEAPAMPAMPASFGGTGALGAGYVQARASLDAEFQRRLAALPPATRAKVERDLAEVRRAAADIAAMLAVHPDHPLLQELLLSSYQNELALLSSVTEVASATETRL